MGCLGLHPKVKQDAWNGLRVLRHQTGLMSPSPTQTISQITKGFQSHPPVCFLRAAQRKRRECYYPHFTVEKSGRARGCTAVKGRRRPDLRPQRNLRASLQTKSGFTEQEHVGGAWGPKQMSLWAMEQGQGGRWFVLHFYIFHRFLQHCSIWARPGKAEQYCGSHERP